MNKKITTIVSFATSALLIVPALASALNIPGSPQGGITSVQGLLNVVLPIIWPLLFVAAFIAMVYAAFLFLTSAGDAAKVAAARQALLWAVIGLIIGILVFSLPLIVTSLFPAGT